MSEMIGIDSLQYKRHWPQSKNHAELGCGLTVTITEVRQGGTCLRLDTDLSCLTSCLSAVP